MQRGFEVYCLADPDFFDSPFSSSAREDDPDFAVARRPVPEGWDTAELDDWLVYSPNPPVLPLQGWKIHISATLDNAERVLEPVFRYCIAHRLTFKFVRSLQLLLVANSKYAHRGGSGKFVTIYLRNEAELEAVAGDLAEELKGEPGPYILSDLRWGDGPVYVRYGGFAERWCLGDGGEMVLAIEAPDGSLVPDIRQPGFIPPSWVALPRCLEPHLAARNAATIDQLPYRIERALHFSNGGGVYAARSASGEAVLLKEGRPYAGLSVDGMDAVTRLRRERFVLERLAGLDVAPAFVDWFEFGGHSFLVEGFVEGLPLTSAIVQRYPLTDSALDDAKVAAYTSWALDMQARVERAVAAVHSRGLVIGDLHPYNILVRPDGRLTLIDFEVAVPESEATQPPLGAPGFAVPRGRSGFAVDRYALACMRFFIFMPLTELIAFRPEKAPELAAEIIDLFGVPRSFLEEAMRELEGSDKAPVSSARRTSLPAFEPTGDGWLSLRASMAAAIRESATPVRDDRLFPGDVQQFFLGGLNLAFGAAGVLYALDVAGVDTQAEHEQWLVDRATRPAPGTRFGFYDGLHGVAYALDHLGRHEEALEVLSICRGQLHDKLEDLGPDLFGGLAGVGLNLLHFGHRSGDSELLEEARAIGEMLASRLGDETSVPEVSGDPHPFAGLFKGASGQALFFIHLFEQGGDTRMLELAATALRQDLRRCLLIADGSLEVNEGWRTMPYLADGSVGIGVVLERYLAHRQDERFSEAAARIRRAAEAIFYIEPGLFYGRAGMMLYLAGLRALGARGCDPVLQAHVRRLSWHALNYRGHLSFPGDYLIRISMDLATGTAGVLLGVAAALHDRPVHLPFMGAPVTAAAREQVPVPG